MLTDKQEETFQKLKAGELTASEKADFYYRLSGILKKELDGIGDLSRLLNEIPDSYLKKIDVRGAAIAAMKLTEKLVERVGPAPIAAKDQDGKYHVYRHFRVDMSGQLRGLTQSTVDIDVVYEPTKEEIQFFGQLMYHITRLEEIYRFNERPNEVFTPVELDKTVASIVKGRPYTSKIVGMVGSPTEETAKNIMTGMPLSETGLPNIDDIDLKDVGLKNSKKEEPPK